MQNTEKNYKLLQFYTPEVFKPNLALDSCVSEEWQRSQVWNVSFTVIFISSSVFININSDIIQKKRVADGVGSGI